MITTEGHGCPDEPTSTRRRVAWRRTAATLSAGILCLAASPHAVAAGADSPLEPVAPVAGIPGDVRNPDLNNDERPDIVAVLFGTDMVSVRINRGDGTFGPSQHYRGSFKASIQETGDFNGDGAVDLAVTNTASPNVSVFLGNGDGTLQPERVTAVGAPSDGPLRGVGAFGLVVRDVDHDGKQDIVAATTAPDHLGLLRGRGDGTFEQPRSFPSPSPLSVFPFGLAHGDFNHDGQDDLISGGVGSVTTYDGRKGGTFVPTKTFNLPGLVIAWIDVADVNGDGNDDAVFTGTGTQNVNVMLGNGDGTFRQGENLFSGGVGPQGLDVGDVNGDGRPDISVANTATAAVEGNVAVFLNTGDGRFRQSFSYPAGLSPFTTSFADFDGDDVPDLLSAIGAPSQVSIARGRGNGTFEPRAIYGM